MIKMSNVLCIDKIASGPGYWKLTNCAPPDIGYCRHRVQGNLPYKPGYRQAAYDLFRPAGIC